jgi:hypothetical protein
MTTDEISGARAKLRHQGYTVIRTGMLEILVSRLWPGCECPPDAVCRYGVMDASPAQCRACWFEWMD